MRNESDESQTNPESFDSSMNVGLTQSVKAANDTEEMVKGIRLIGAFHLVVFILALFYIVIMLISESPRTQSLPDILMGLILAAVFFFEVLAVVQFVYVLPAIIIAAVKKRYGILKGVVIAMSLTLLLAGGSFALCTAIFMSGAFRIAG